MHLDFYLGHYVVLLFYPGDFNPQSFDELLAFNEWWADFKDWDAELIAVSVDSETTHLSWMQLPFSRGGVMELRYPLVSDFHKEISYIYGVLDAKDGQALPSYIIIDPHGFV